MRRHFRGIIRPGAHSLRTRQGVVTAALIAGIFLLVVWLLALAGSYTMGGFIYVALLAGVILVFVSLVTRARARRA